MLIGNTPCILAKLVTEMLFVVTHWREILMSLRKPWFILHLCCRKVYEEELKAWILLCLDSVREPLSCVLSESVLVFILQTSLSSCRTRGTPGLCSPDTRLTPRDRMVPRSVPGTSSTPAPAPAPRLTVSSDNLLVVMAPWPPCGLQWSIDCILPLHWNTLVFISTKVVGVIQ